MDSNIQGTPFSIVYNTFLSKVTDDMYMELTKQDTYGLLQELLLNAIPRFEFPRVDLFDYVLAELKEQSFFVARLSREEMNILATYMVVEWLGQQLASVENVRMKYSGSDFKFTSQANHMQKLLALKKDYEREGFHLQRLYKRRKTDVNGIMRSTFGTIMDGVDIVRNAEVTKKEIQTAIEELTEKTEILQDKTKGLEGIIEEAVYWDGQTPGEET